MADFCKNKITTVEHRYVLNSPTPMAELGKAYMVAMREWKAANPGGTEYDNTIMVRSYDEEIHLYWTEETS